MGLLEQAIDEFGRHMKVERNLSEHTRDGYLTDLKQFQTFLKTREVSGGTDEAIPIDPMVIRSFLASLYRGNCRKVTVSRKVAALRSFYRYLHREGKVSMNPAELVQLPRCEKYIPAVLSADEMLALLQMKFPEDAAGLRDRSMLELFYSAGIRLSELTGLDLGDIRSSEGLVKVKGKGRKERIVPVGRQALQALEAYLRKRPELRKGGADRDAENALFLS
ncbi:MAG: site-specific integrase, partial [Syntrophales bacterium]|nr:site-specific integrase [Syntrophales bacterium]